MEAYKILRAHEEETVKSMMGLSIDKAIPDSILTVLAEYKNMLNRVDSSICPSQVAFILISKGWKAPKPVESTEEVEAEVPEEVVVEESKPQPDEVFKEEKPEPEPEPAHKYIKDGTLVVFSANGEDLEGLIESHQANDEDVYYSITVDGRDDAFMVHEDDVSEIKGT